MQTTTSVVGQQDKKLTPAVLIRAEANILRYPIFYLHTKGLSTIDNVSCEGNRTVEGKSQNFKLTSSRNSRFLYPGPFARKVHHALMSLLQKRGLPYANFVEFTWRQLAKEMRISWHGKLSTDLRDAIRSIAGLLITSESALIDGTTRQPIQDIEKGFQLVDEFVFANSQLADGTTANRNRVVFSEWLVANLNARYFATYRYDVWLDLAEQSVIASRMYEYLLHSFSGHHPIVKINYDRLCKFLPVKQYKTQYRAERQFGRVLESLVKHEVLSDFAWAIGKQEQMMLQLKPGRLLRPNSGKTINDSTSAIEDMTVSEVHSDATPAEELVSIFYSKWTGVKDKPANKREVELANDMIERFGRIEAKETIRYVVRVLKSGWPEARSFTATRDYWDAAHKLLRKTNGVAEQELRRREQEAQSHQNKQERKDRLRKIWISIPREKQQEIIDHVHHNENSTIVKSFESKPKIYEMYLLNELERRQ